MFAKRLKLDAGFNGRNITGHTVDQDVVPYFEDYISFLDDLFFGTPASML